MNKDVYLWKINIKTDSSEDVNPFDFCKNNNILGFGWQLEDDNGNRR